MTTSNVLLSGFVRETLRSGATWRVPDQCWEGLLGVASVLWREAEQIPRSWPLLDRACRRGNVCILDPDHRNSGRSFRAGSSSLRASEVRHPVDVQAPGRVGRQLSRNGLGSSVHESPPRRCRRLARRKDPLSVCRSANSRWPCFVRRSLLVEAVRHDEAAMTSKGISEHR